MDSSSRNHLQSLSNISLRKCRVMEEQAGNRPEWQNSISQIRSEKNLHNSNPQYNQINKSKRRQWYCQEAQKTKCSYHLRSLVEFRNSSVATPRPVGCNHTALQQRQDHQLQALLEWPSAGKSPMCPFLKLGEVLGVLLLARRPEHVPSLKISQQRAHSKPSLLSRRLDPTRWHSTVPISHQLLNQ